MVVVHIVAGWWKIMRRWSRTITLDLLEKQVETSTTPTGIATTDTSTDTGMIWFVCRVRRHLRRIGMLYGAGDRPQ